MLKIQLQGQVQLGLALVACAGHYGKNLCLFKVTL